MTIRRRFTLRRADGRVYLDRWGFGIKRFGAIMLHRMDAPDPGLDLHDHPWTFVSIVLSGGYTEERASIREASAFAALALKVRSDIRGAQVRRGRWSVRRMRLDEAHRITTLHGDRCWTLVVCGPVRRAWGFYLAEGWMDERTYDDTVRVVRRDLIEDGGYIQTTYGER